MSDAQGRRALVVSHPSVVSVNQEVYRELRHRGWDVTIVVPRAWRHSYSSTPVRPQALDGMEDALRPLPVLLAGRQQRHFYLARCRALCAELRPDVAFIEEEPFAVATMQWRRAFMKLGVPFGVQCYENIDRDLPAPVRRQRTKVLHDAAFVAARSPTSADLARKWGARGEIGIAPPAVPEWSIERVPHDTFTIGYAGRLVESKGVLDLLSAVQSLAAPIELYFFGNGELKDELDGQPVPGSHSRVLSGLTHEEMASAYAKLDVLVLPSRTTPTWREQFGRVIVEALWCGTPVIGSDSGEIPWLIGLTGGGLVFPEGDRRALADRLQQLRGSPESRARLAANGREAVEQRFSVQSATDPLESLLNGARRRRRSTSAQQPPVA